MKDEYEDELMSAEEFFGTRRNSQPRKRSRPAATAKKSAKVQHGEAEIGLVMEIKGVTRAKAIKILDERVARMNAAPAESNDDPFPGFNI